LIIKYAVDHESHQFDR